MKGNYKLFRQADGRTGFAHVYVQIISWHELEDKFMYDIDQNDVSTISPVQDSEFFDAATEGCKACLQNLREQNIAINFYEVKITRVLINRVDTQPDAIRASAFLATASAFSVEDQFQLVFQDEWKVVERDA